jgi:Flp pilus assembly protein protease CpaA
MTPLDTLLLIPLYSILLYIVPLCYLDLKYREVNNWYWLPLVLVNAPVTAYMYWYGWYPWYCLLTSIIITGIFAVMVLIDFLNGADFLFLLFITFFWIINPNPWPHGIQLQFYFYLLTAMAITAIITFSLNCRAKRYGSWIEMINNYPRGVPFMLSISLAFILSYLLG